MNSFQRTQMRHSLHRLIADLGGALHNIKRAPLDGNGQPQGEPTIVGALFGVSYRRNQTSAGLKIDLPGIVATADNARHFVAVANEIMIPAENDLIEVDGAYVPIVLANFPPGNILYDLILKD